MYLATLMYKTLNGALIRQVIHIQEDLKTYLGLANDVDGLIRILYRESGEFVDGTQKTLLTAMKNKTLPEE